MEETENEKLSIKRERKESSVYVFAERFIFRKKKNFISYEFKEREKANELDRVLLFLES